MFQTLTLGIIVFSFLYDHYDLYKFPATKNPVINYYERHAAYKPDEKICVKKVYGKTTEFRQGKCADWPEVQRFFGIYKETEMHDNLTWKF